MTRRKWMDIVCLVLISGVFSTPLASAEESKLILYYPFDMGFSRTAIDKSGTGYDGIIHGCKWTQGRFGKGLKFDGADDYLTTGFVSLADSDYTMEAWIKPETELAEKTCYLIGPQCYDRHCLKIVNGKLCLWHRDKSGKNIYIYSPPCDFQKGQWYHIAGTFSKKNGMALYLNGKRIASRKDAIYPSAWSVCVIGGTGTAGKAGTLGKISGLFEGIIDEIRIYKKALSDQEIKQDYLWSGSQTTRKVPGQLTLVTDGKPQAVIVIDEKAHGCIEYAASELQNTIVKISGAKLPIIRIAKDSQVNVKEAAKGKTLILLGASSFTRALGYSAQTFPPDGFQIRTQDNVLVILGKDDADFKINFDWVPSSAGTLYGTYRFLEELGVRWFYPSKAGEIIPAKKDILLKNMNIKESPYFPYRFAYGNMAWRRRVGYGGDRDPWATRHTFTQTINWAKKFATTHPEYFCLNKEGKLTNNLFHIAFAHPGVVDEIIKEARSYFQSNRPEGKKSYFLVVPNDYWMEMCACPRCQSKVDYTRPAEGIFSDYVAEAVVKVAEALKDEFPNRYIVYCAYEHYKLPPVKIKTLPSNVVVLIAQSRRGFYSKQQREKAYAIIKAWQKLRPAAIYFCRYYTYGASKIPMLMPHMIAEDIAMMKRLSEQGPAKIRGEMHFGGVGEKSRNSWWFHLNEYVTAKCLWNPDLNVDDLLEDYYQKFYGPAAPEMKKLFSAVEKAYYAETRYSKKMLKTLEDYLRKARSKTSGTAFAANVKLVDKGLEPLRGILKVKKQRRVKQDKPSENKTSLTQNEGPVLDYTFDRGLSEIARDESGHDNHGIIVGASRVESRFGRALQFDGKDDYLMLRKPICFGDAYTIEAWIKPAAVFRKTLYSREKTEFYPAFHIIGSPASCHQWDRLSLSIRNGKLCFHDKDIGTIFSDGELHENRWYHVAAVFSNSEGMSLYINGELVGSNVDTQARPSGSRTPLMSLIGATGGVSSRYADTIADKRGFFKGIIDEVKVYRRALTGNEIKHHYQKR